MSPQFLPVPQGSPALEPPLFQVDTYFKLKKLIQLSCYPLMCCEREKWATRLTFEPDLEWPTQRECCICSYDMLTLFPHFFERISTFVWQFSHLFERRQSGSAANVMVWIWTKFNASKNSWVRACVSLSGWLIIRPMGSFWQHGSKLTAFWWRNDRSSLSLMSSF